ncbi:hypothetical protein EP47_04170 [Legionella norrlandica]|uniref:Uncharacterized protein n=1 Tax=Legionella norrlandica TaxID=1498499 RepID=A0A0A2T9Z5_9GAMM|nr:hypothetical protein [Legionella norrlandica]KGP64253.1 hypothetical protein EP47_04170 [Legionella norrlandica]
MQASLIKPESKEFRPWNSPHLLSNQFQLFAKFITALNSNTPPEQVDNKDELLKELEFNIINVFSHQMMPSWLALAKSYYPFYKKSNYDKALIEVLEHKLNIKATDYESLSMLIKEVFLTKYPTVNSQYQPIIDNIKTVMAKLTAVALSTPSLLNDAHQRDKKQFEEAGPSMSTCVGSIETILHHMMKRAEINKSFVISATSLLLQVKAIKSHFEQITLIQQLESTQKKNKELQEQLEKDKPGMQVSNLAQKSQGFDEEQSRLLQSWQSKEEQMALAKVFKLQKRIKEYCDHLTEALVKLPKDEKISAKLASMTVMKNDLDNEKVLPSQRIGTFGKQLNKANEQLKEHRDPMWGRFLRDCCRILAFTLSGVAMYRKLTGQPVDFFKPSHGQRFVEEATRITTAHLLI